jgi:carboxyl-terminal processing protease
MGENRIATDTIFQLIRQHASWLAEQNDKTYSLQIDQYKKEQELIRASVRKLDSLQQLKNALTVKALSGEENRWVEDKPKQERFERWLKNLQKDIYLDQGVKVMQDIQQQRSLVGKSKGF